MDLADNLLAYWSFDTSSWLDSTPNAYNLTQVGDNVSVGTGIIDGDASFSGGGTYLKSDPSFNPLSGTEFSVSGWLKTTSVGTIVSGNSGGIYGFDISWSNSQPDQPRFLVGSNNSYEICQGNINISNDAWHHFVGTYNQNGNITLYIDGNLNHQITASGNSPNGCLNGVGINNDADGNGYGAGGAAQIDEVAIWNRELSAEEVTKLYNSGAGYAYPFGQTPTDTLYYNDAQEDGDWGNLLNWWRDSGFAIQATALPTDTNPVNLYNQVTQNTQGADQCFCASASFWSANFGEGLTLQSTGVVNMQGTSVMAGATTDGVSMHDSSQLTSTSVVDGNVTMRDASRAFGTILGNATIYYDGGDGQYPIGGTVTGSVTYLGWPAKTPQWFNDLATGGANDGDFNNLVNWWSDNTYITRPLNAEGTQELPDASTDVFIAPNTGIVANTGTANPTINSVTANDSNIQNISITATNGFLFSGNEGVANAVLYGDVIFQDTAYNDHAVIQGKATYKSAASLQYSWGQNSLGNVNAGMYNGSTSFEVDIQAQAGNSNKGFLSSLLGFPWYIRF
jgi:hypothetical protein